MSHLFAYTPMSLFYCFNHYPRAELEAGFEGIQFGDVGEFVAAFVVAQQQVDLFGRELCFQPFSVFVHKLQYFLVFRFRFDVADFHRLI